MFGFAMTRRFAFVNFVNFKLGEFARQDYKTICGLLKQKYQYHNDQIQTISQIKLLDDAGRTIGIYIASQARKKAMTLNLDMVLVNGKMTPIICKITNFRQKLLNKFYQEVVVKRNQKLISKATSTKSLKISMMLNANDMRIKVKQILELAKKNLKVRVYMVCKQTTRDDCLQKLQSIKSQVQNKCYIEQQISNKRYEQKEEQAQEEDLQQKKYKKEKKEKSQTYSFVMKAKDSEFVKNLLQQGEELMPELSIKNFLKKYYKQEDSEMMDLKSSGAFELVPEGIEDHIIKSLVERQKVESHKVESKRVDSQKVESEKDVKVRSRKQEDPYKSQEMMREAQARILNSRLKALLSLY